MSSIIDFHSHVLPGIDDGSQSPDESVTMLKMMVNQGIRRVVATPHFYARYDEPKEYLLKRYDAIMALREEMERHENMPKLAVGAEVHFFPGMSHSSILSHLTIGGKRCILVEMPGSPWDESMYRELENISLKQDLIPVVAHVDRYISPFRTHHIPERLEELPVLVQANASFFLHSNTRRMALKMLEKDQIQLLGSDCHNLTTRKPNLGKAVEVIQQKLGSEVLERIYGYQKEVLK